VNYREKMKIYLKEPDEHSSQYGKWGALNREQRTLIKRLLNEMDNADIVIKNQFEEIERLNNIINGMEKFFQYAYDNEVRPLNDRKVSVWTICLDKLQELKGSGNND